MAGKKSFIVLTVLIMSLLLLPLISATDVANDFGFGWGVYQDDKFNNGRLDAEAIPGDFTAEQVTNIFGFGTLGVQPIALDIDNDTFVEFIVGQGSTLYILNADKTGFTIEDTFSAPSGSSFTYALAFNQSSVVDDFNEIIVAFGNETLWLRYNGSEFTILAAVNDTGFAGSGIQCNDYFTTVNQSSCYWLASGGDAGFNVTTFNLTGSSISSTRLLATGTEMQMALPFGQPTMQDIDADGFEDIIITARSGRIRYVAYQPQTDSLNTNLLGGTGTIEIFLNGEGAGRSHGQILSSQDASRFDIYGTGSVAGGASSDNTFIYRIRGDTGAVLWATKLTDIPLSTGVEPPVLADFVTIQGEFTAVPEICAITPDGSFACFTLNDGSMIMNISLDGGLDRSFPGEGGAAGGFFSNTTVVIAADMDGDGDLDLVTNRKIFFLDAGTNSSTSLSYAQATTDDNHVHIVVDVNGDSFLDICGQRAGETYCSFSDATNQPPVLDNNQRFGGYENLIGYDTLICLDTAINFRAQESGGVFDSSLFGNYNNDVSTDIERIVSNCGQTGTGNVNPSFTGNLLNGTFDDPASPVFQCIYNNTGTYSVRLFLQDDSHDELLTTFNTETIVFTVVEGDPGIDCNRGTPSGIGGAGNVTTGTPGDASEQEEALVSLLDIITGRSIFLKLLFGLGILIGVIVAVAQKAESPFVIGFAGVATLIILTLLGFFPFWVVILLLVAITLFAIFNRIIF